MTIRCPSRAETLSAVLPVEDKRGGVVFRFATEQQRATFLDEERRVLTSLSQAERQEGRR